MAFNSYDGIPFIPRDKYDDVAHEFLERYCPEALKDPMPVPIEEIAKTELGLDVQYICLSEEQDTYGMTIFTDGNVEIYVPSEQLYETKFFKAKTVLIDPEVVKKTNIGCLNNTIAHECVHWFKHRLYYKIQNISLPKYAKFCKCRIDQLPEFSEKEGIMEAQAIGIAPRILMPKSNFIEEAEFFGVAYGKDNSICISKLANFFRVSKQSVKIRLEECCLI